MTAPRLLVVPEDTTIGAIALADVSIHELVELYEERQVDPDHPIPHMVVILRTPEGVLSATLHGSAVVPKEAFPEDRYPGLAEAINADPYFLDGIDLAVPTSGSNAGNPRLVGLSIEALMASIKATGLALGGPGHWILVMPTHHTADAMILLCAAVAEVNLQIISTSEGFNPCTPLPAIQDATQDGMPDCLSLVPTRLVQCLDAGEEVVRPMHSLASILVGGAVTNQQPLARATEAGLKVCLTCGMTETVGGCVYDGKLLPGMSVRTVDWDGRACLAIHGPTLMTRYLDTESPFFDEGGHCWLLTGDLGIARASGTVEVHGHADDVIVSGGLSITLGPVRPTVHSFEGVSGVRVMGAPDEKWGHVVAALVVVDQIPSDSLKMAKFGLAIHERVVVHIRCTRAPCQTVTIESLPYLGFDKIDHAAAAQAVAEALGTGREWVR